jgi:hypothetical protein
LKTPHKAPVSLVEALKRVAAINAAGRDALLEAEASTFLVKARKWPGSTFIIGSDTLERMLDPKYGHEVEPMLKEMGQLRTRFKVSQRDGTASAKQLIEECPVPLWHHGPTFYLLPHGQHAGMSSTRLRK